MTNQQKKTTQPKAIGSPKVQGNQQNHKSAGADPHQHRERQRIEGIDDNILQREEMLAYNRKSLNSEIELFAEYSELPQLISDQLTMLGDKIFSATDEVERGEAKDLFARVTSLLKFAANLNAIKARDQVEEIRMEFLQIKKQYAHLSWFVKYGTEFK